MEKETSLEEKFEEANLLLRYREFEQACSIYEELISQGFNSPELHNNYGLALFYLNKVEDSLREFEESIRLDNSFALPYANIGLVHLNNMEYDKAVEFFKKALEFDKGNPETHYNLAVTYYRIGKKDDALQHYEAFLKFAGDEYGKLKESVYKIINQITESKDKDKEENSEA